LIHMRRAPTVIASKRLMMCEKPVQNGFRQAAACGSAKSLNDCYRASTCVTARTE
jgi:hypothetical protein